MELPKDPIQKMVILGKKKGKKRGKVCGGNPKRSKVCREKTGVNSKISGAKSAGKKGGRKTIPRGEKNFQRGKNDKIVRGRTRVGWKQNPPATTKKCQGRERNEKRDSRGGGGGKETQ